jgi:hypothetical protein
MRISDILCEWDLIEFHTIQIFPHWWGDFLCEWNVAEILNGASYLSQYRRIQSCKQLRCSPIRFIFSCSVICLGWLCRLWPEWAHEASPIALVTQHVQLMISQNVHSCASCENQSWLIFDFDRVISCNPLMQRVCFIQRLARMLGSLLMWQCIRDSWLPLTRW